jgi:arginyl-tRNA synthetase
MLEEIKKLIESAIIDTYGNIDHPPVELALAPDGMGDIATQIPFKLAKILHKPPFEIASKIAKNISSNFINAVNAVKPGYININLSPTFYNTFVTEVESKKIQFFQEKKKDIKIQVEFVSANPTGPLHVGNGRGGIIGDVLSNVLKLEGYGVSKEYYVNDAGSKMDLFTDSIAYYYAQLCGIETELPEDGYKGEYIKNIAEDIYFKFKDRYAKNGKIDREAIKDLGKDFMIWQIQKSLAKFGVFFDFWFYESSLYKNGDVEKTIELFKKSGYTYEKDGALWFKTTIFGDDKDRVLVRKTGEPTYTLVDAAYHKNKWDRGYRKAIDIWGADHFGHIIPMKALIQGLGIPKDFLDVIIYQIVHLYEDGKEVMMSKHTGTFITLDELIEEVGKDAARFFFLLKSADTHLNFDMTLAKKESVDNPVFYVQYTYARLNNILQKAKDSHIEIKENFNSKNLKEKEERDLLNELLFVKENITGIAKTYAVNKLPFLAIDVCKKANAFYQKHKVIGAQNENERLHLIRTVLIVLALLMDLMGIEKKEKM